MRVEELSLWRRANLSWSRVSKSSRCGAVRICLGLGEPSAEIAPVEALSLSRRANLSGSANPLRRSCVLKRSRLLSESPPRVRFPPGPRSAPAPAQEQQFSGTKAKEKYGNFAPAALAGKWKLWIRIENRNFCATVAREVHSRGSGSRIAFFVRISSVRRTSGCKIAILRTKVAREAHSCSSGSKVATSEHRSSTQAMVLATGHERAQRLVSPNAMRLNCISVPSVAGNMLSQAPSPPTGTHNVLETTNQAKPTQVRPNLRNAMPPKERGAPLPPTLNQPRVKRFYRTARRPCLSQRTLGAKASQRPSAPGVANRASK